MSGPKSSSYTLTYEQRQRILEEQRRQREIEEERRRCEAEKTKQKELQKKIDVEAGKLAGQIERLSQLKKESGYDIPELDQAIKIQEEIKSQSKALKAENGLTSQKLQEQNNKLTAVLRKAVACNSQCADQITKVTDRYRKELDSVISEGFHLSFSGLGKGRKKENDSQIRTELSGMTLSDKLAEHLATIKKKAESITDEIIPSVNEGLHVLHENGIIHKDVKPSNIMLNNDGRTASIIDFGISSLRENGATVVVTKTGLTPEYSAPETFRNLFLNESDYYSFGVTIYELYCGHTPYSEMSQEEIEQFISIQKLPMPDGMEKDLQELINALTYPDITNRRDKSNPNRRWGYEEICNWCNDVPQPLPGGAVNQAKVKASISQPRQSAEDDMLPYRFGGKSITSTAVLVDALNGRWEEAKKHLLRGLLLAHFQKDSNAEIISNLMDIEEEADTVDADVLVFKSFYMIDSTLRDFLWKGQRYSDLSELGKKYLSSIRSNDPEFLQTMDEMVNKGILSQYLKFISPDEKDQIDALLAVESRFKLAKTTADEKLCSQYQLAYLLSDTKDYVVDGKAFCDITSFADYVSSKASENGCTFEKTLRDIIYSNKKFDIQFSSWLTATGKPILIEGQNSDKAFFHMIYNMRSDIKALLWEGYEFANLQELGRKWLQSLQERDSAFIELANSMLSLGILTYYAENVDVLKKRKLDKLKKAEATSASLSSLSYNDYYLFEYNIAYLLSEEKVLRFNGDEFADPDKLLEKLDSLLNSPFTLASYCSSQNET